MVRGIKSLINSGDNVCRFDLVIGGELIFLRVRIWI